MYYIFNMVEDSDFPKSICCVREDFNLINISVFKDIYIYIYI